MKNRTEKNVLRSSCGIFAAALLLLAEGATTSWATVYTVAGTECQAYNNNQANALERSHVRLLNPATNTQSLWVICSVQKNSANVVTGIIGATVGYFGPGVTANIDCVWREFHRDSIHTPGGLADAGHTINAEAFTINNPGATPAVTWGLYTPTTFDTFEDNYHTVACKLPPGTGINENVLNLF